MEVTLENSEPNSVIWAADLVTPGTVWPRSGSIDYASTDSVWASFDEDSRSDPRFVMLIFIVRAIP